MKQGYVATWGFLAVAILSMVAALVPLFKGDAMNVTFLGAGVIFFVVAVVTARKAREREKKPPA